MQAASDCLAQSAKLSKKLDDPFKSVVDALGYANDVVNGKLDVSKKENEFIYHEKVPELDALQEIKVRFNRFLSLRMVEYNRIKLIKRITRYWNLEVIM